MKKHNLAFTLAETLVVMGIIGVVAALTLPNVTQSTGNKETVAKVLKARSDIQNAYNSASAKNGRYLNSWFANDSSVSAYSARFAARLATFLNIDENCSNTTNGSCFSKTNYTAISGSSTVTTPYSSADYYKYKLKDGTDVAFYCEKSSTSYCKIFIDVDGQGGYNVAGKDFFMFYVRTDTNGALTTSVSSSHNENVLKTGCRTLSEQLAFFNVNLNHAYYCSEWILRYGNMDYLLDDNTHKPIL